jgi:LuxR family transcriptional regulator, maltose regulon positive regulatory protein
MARSTPRVASGTLQGFHGQPDAIAVGTPAWYAWLEQATTFAFTAEQGSFTARKERSRQSGWYWKAYRKHAGTLHRAYLGKSAELTLDRLTAIATQLAQRATGSPPLVSATVRAPAPPPANDHPPLPRGAQLPQGTLTFLFTDVEGSTQLWEQHPQTMPHALARHDAILREAVETHGGVVFKTVGDGVYAVFMSAPAALKSALAIQLALQREEWPATGQLRVRLALHTGVAEARQDDYFGSTLNRLARLVAAGHGGQILLSQATAALVGDALFQGTTLRDLGSHALKDFPSPEPIFQLVVAELPSEFPPLRILDRSPARASLPLHLLATKLYAPHARPDLVARPHLFERLTAGLSSKLTLVAAPAGFGKTTLVSAWIAALSATFAQSPHVKTSIAWVSLDARDNDSTHFWSYISVASNTLAPGSGDTALALLQGLQPPIEAIVTTLVNGLSAALPRDGASTPAVLVLDDYHTIEAPAIQRALTTFVEHLPPQLHLVIATRADPPLPLARLRAGRQLNELRAADLRFSAEEAASFLTEVMGLPLSEADIAMLEARTEGWIAGLQLAALAMRDRSDLASFIASFTGSNRFVMHYLAEEVFARQPSHIQTFLLHTGILDRMCGPLCDAILGLIPDQLSEIKKQGYPRAPASATSVDQQAAPVIVGPSSDSYSQLIFDQLERDNLFLIPLDDARHWYRYHHLLSDVLRARLRSGTTPATVAELHRRASLWYEGQGLIVEATHHALAAPDWERAVRLIEAHGVLLMMRGQIQTTLSWLNALPADVMQRHPFLCIVHAIGLLLSNQVAATEARLYDAEHSLQPETPEELARLVRGGVVVLRGYIRYFAGDLAQAINLIQQALELLPIMPANGAVGIMSAFARSVATARMTTAYKLTGDVTAASERRVAEAIAPVQATGDLTVTLKNYTYLAWLQVLQGRLRTAAATYAEVERLVPGQEALQALSTSPAYYFGIGDLQCQWNDLDAAEAYLTRGMELVRTGLDNDAQVIMSGYLALARMQQARGHGAAALVTLDTFVQVAHKRKFFELLIDLAAALRARLQLRQGDLAAASRWADASSLSPDDELNFLREAAYLTLVRVRIAGGQAKAVLPLLSRLLADAQAKARMHSAIEILSLQALAYDALGKRSPALTALEDSLVLAEPEGYIRMFVDEGAPMAKLLQAGRAQGIAPNYISKLLAAFPTTEVAEAPHAVINPQSSTVLEPLTERELEILHLIAEGLSNQAIAERLIIAVSTVKRHINNLFGKLAVESRTQALVRARELRLL